MPYARTALLSFDGKHMEMILSGVTPSPCSYLHLFISIRHVLSLIVRYDRSLDVSTENLSTIAFSSPPPSSSSHSPCFAFDSWGTEGGRYSLRATRYSDGRGTMRPKGRWRESSENKCKYLTNNGLSTVIAQSPSPNLTNTQTHKHTHAHTEFLSSLSHPIPFQS